MDNGNGWQWDGLWCGNDSYSLMDEPLSNLDARLRVQIRAELGELLERLHTSPQFISPGDQADDDLG